VTVSVWFADLLASELSTLLERWAVRITAAGIALLFGLASVVLIVGALVWPQLLGISRWPQAATIIAGAVLVLVLVAAAAMMVVRLLRSSDRPLVLCVGAGGLCGGRDGGIPTGDAGLRRTPLVQTDRGARC